MNDNTTMQGTLRTFEDYRQQADWHTGNADGLAKVLELYGDEIPEQMKSYLQGERRHHRQQTTKCLEIALKILKEK